MNNAHKTTSVLKATWTSSVYPGAHGTCEFTTCRDDPAALKCTFAYAEDSPVKLSPKEFICGYTHDAYKTNIASTLANGTMMIFSLSRTSSGLYAYYASVQPADCGTMRVDSKLKWMEKFFV